MSLVLMARLRRERDLAIRQRDEAVALLNDMGISDVHWPDEEETR